MSFDVEISIFGRVAAPAGVAELADAAASEGHLDWATQIDADEFVGLLEKAERERRALVLTRRDTYDDAFDAVKTACRAAGLSYVMFIGDKGAENFSNGATWHPGMTEEREFLLAGKEPVLKAADVRTAAAHGVEAVTALVERVTNATRVGRIEIEDGFVAAYDAFLAGREAAEDDEEPATGPAV